MEMDSFSKSSYKEHSEKYIPYIIDHFKQKGLILKPGSRFNTYKKILQELANCTMPTDYDAVIEKYEMALILASLKETMQTYQILKALNEFSDNNYLNILNMIASGVLIPDANEIHTGPRDILFELDMAAHFKNAGFNIRLDEPDIVIKRENDEIYLACKRPNSKKNLKNTIKKARRQIAAKGHGIICLSLDKLLNYDANVLQINKDENIGQKVRSVMNDFWTKWDNDIHKWLNNDRKIFGIILHFSCVSDFKREAIFTVCKQFFLISTCSDSSPYFDFLKNIEKYFKPLSDSQLSQRSVFGFL